MANIYLYIMYVAAIRKQNLTFMILHYITRGPFYQHGLTLIPAWISKYIHYKVCDEITYPSLNFNGATVEV